MLRGMKRAMIAVAVVLLAGCTPDEIQMVVDDYAAHMRAQTEPREPTLTITADCDALTIHGENWPAASVITPGIGGDSPLFLLHPDSAGTVDGVWATELHWRGWSTVPVSYYWSVTGDTDSVEPGIPLMALHGDVDC